MRHAYMYSGGFELNHPELRPGATSYKTTDGSARALPPWPDKVDGVHIGYMEKAGKKFFAVRVQYEGYDIVLDNPVSIDPLRHLNNQRFAPEPTIVSDDEVSLMLDDILRDNPNEQAELALMINRINQVRRGARPTAE